MASRPFFGAKQPPPVPFLDDYLPPARSAFDKAAEPILRAVLAMEDIPPVRAIQQPVAKDTVVSASMSYTGASSEIYPLRLLDVDPSVGSFTSPSKIYIHDLDLDLRVGWAVDANDATPAGSAKLYHPLDQKMGLRVALLEFDLSYGVNYRANPGAPGGLSWPPALRDLLVEPNGYIGPPNQESLYIEGPTDATQYYSPWRRSIDQGERSQEASYTANDVLPTVGNVTLTSMWAARGQPNAGPRASTGVQLRTETPSNYCFRVLYDRQHEFACQFGEVQTTGTVVPDSVDGNQASYVFPSELQWRIPTYHGRIREKIKLRRTYNFRQATDFQFGTAYPLVNNCPRRLMLVLIPKGSCRWSKDFNTTSFYFFYTPRIQRCIVEMTGATQSNLQQTDQTDVTKNDGWVEESEVQRPQRGRPKIDMGERHAGLSRRDRSY